MLINFRIFLVDTLNFSFWSDDGDKKFAVTYNNKQYAGYWSLCAAVNRALDVSASKAIVISDVAESNASNGFKSCLVCAAYNCAQEKAD